MQGDTLIVDGISYETVDEQRCKCLTCNKVIYKLLQRAHSYSHSSTKLTVEQQIKPVINAVKKFSLQPDFIILQKPALPISSNSIESADPKPSPQKSDQKLSDEKGDLIKPSETVETIEKKNLVKAPTAKQQKTSNYPVLMDLTKNNKDLLNTSTHSQRINNKGSFLDCLKKSQNIRAYMQKSINSFYRGLFVVYLKHFS